MDQWDGCPLTFTAAVIGSFLQLRCNRLSYPAGSPSWKNSTVCASPWLLMRQYLRSDRQQAEDINTGGHAAGSTHFAAQTRCCLQALVCKCGNDQ